MSDGKMTPETAAKFIDLMVASAPALGDIKVTILRWPFPWLNPWRWPSWLVWRLRRGRKTERYAVPTLTFGPKEKP